ncbi:MAG: hypothetical protein AAFV95_11800 [Bacteroidota bacterium]
MASQNFSKAIDLNGDSDNGYSLYDMGDGILIDVNGLCNNNTDFCAGLIKIDYNGEVIWKREINELYRGGGDQQIVIAKDRIYLFGQPNQEALQLDPEEREFWLMELDREGRQLRTLRLPREEQEYGRCLLENEGGLLLASNPIVGNSSMHFRQIDLDGNILWDAYYRGNLWAVDGRKMRPTFDGNYVLSHVSKSPYTGGDWTGLVTKLTAKGEKIWETPLDTVLYPFHSSDGPLVGLDDGSFVSAYLTEVELDINRKDRFYPCVYKLDAVGHILWRKVMIDDYANDLLQLRKTKNGEILGVGVAEGLQADPGEQDLPTQGGWLFRLTAEGEKLWERDLLDTSLTDFKGIFSDVLELQDGSLLLSGTINSPAPPDDTIFVDNPDVWLLKLGADGCFNPDCGPRQLQLQFLESTTSIPSIPKLQNISLSPNPTANVLRLQWEMDKEDLLDAVLFRILNVTGKVYLSGEISSNQKEIALRVDELPPGPYVIQVFNASQNHILGASQFIKL